MTSQPLQPRRRYATRALVIVAIMVVLTTAAWLSGAVTARLSASPVAIEPSAPGHVRIRVDLRNNGLIAATPSSVMSESTPPVRGVEPYANPDPETFSEAEARTMLPTGWTLRGRESRQLTLELRIPCDTPPQTWKLRLIAYVRGNGNEVTVPWKDGTLPAWRTEAVRVACPA